MIRCVICEEYFESSDKKWLNIIDGNDVAICPSCNEDETAKANYKKGALKKIPTSVIKIAGERKEKFTKIAKESKARQKKALS